MRPVAEIKARFERKKETPSGLKRLLRRCCREPDGYAPLEGLYRFLDEGLDLHKNQRLQVLPSGKWTFADYMDFAASTRRRVCAHFFAAKTLPPVFWIGEDLLEALLLTDLGPANVSDIKIPYPSAALVLPQGVIKSPEGESVNFLVWRHFSPHWDEEKTLFGRPLDGPVDLATSSIMWSTEVGPFIHAGNFGFEQDSFLHEVYHGASGSEKELDLDNQFNHKLQCLLVQVVHLLTQSGELIENNEQLERQLMGRRHKKDRKSRQLEPNWIGKNYRLPRKEHQGGTHSSPIAHWRRGHWRAQNYGPRSQQRTKQIWIPPTVVGLGGGETNA